MIRIDGVEYEESCWSCGSSSFSLTGGPDGKANVIRCGFCGKVRLKKGAQPPASGWLQKLVKHVAGLK